MPLGKVYCLIFIEQKVLKKRLETRLNGKYLFLYFQVLDNNLNNTYIAMLYKVLLQIIIRESSVIILYIAMLYKYYSDDSRNASDYIDLNSNLNNIVYFQQSKIEDFDEGERITEEVPEEECIKDNSVSNQIRPRKQPGLYMIRCTVNDKRYYGESKNVSGRLASHKSQLNRKIHPNSRLQHDWNTFGEDCFEFNVLFMGSNWENREERIAKETLLIVQDRHLCYNYLEGQSRPTMQNPFYQKKHTDETKKKIGDSMRGIPNNKLGKAIRLDGVIYPSLTEASRITKHSRKFIRKRLQNSNDSGCTEI